MPNPFTPLQNALRVLVTEAEVLPATGQAVVDLVTPDLEEIYDQRTGGPASVESIWEVPNRSLYRTVKPVYRQECHRLRYFVDGSALTYFIGTVLEEDRSSPVQLSQVGAAMVCRQDNGRVRLTKNGLRRSILLTLERNQLSDPLWNALEQALQGLGDFVLCDSATNNRYAEAMNLQESRPRGAHRANWHMRELERDLAENIPRGDDEWLVIDGSLGNEFETWRGAPVIGIAKTFRRDSRFELGSGPRAVKLNLYGLLKDLLENQRTIVFSRSDEGKILFWYVRIRPQRGLDYPLMGVVKVEFPNPDQRPVDSEQVDQISSWVMAERSVTPHGRDGRWHAHLYPIHITERVIRGNFYSDEVIKTGIRWPFPVR
ncbi:MAG: hypothetical protein Fur0022_02230 [Anaerolineales bacterium]